MTTRMAGRFGLEVVLEEGLQTTAVVVGRVQQQRSAAFDAVGVDIRLACIQ